MLLCVTRTEKRTFLAVALTNSIGIVNAKAMTHEMIDSVPNELRLRFFWPLTMCAGWRYVERLA
jgi:hypothetical protein